MFKRVFFIIISLIIISNFIISCAGKEKKRIITPFKTYDLNPLLKKDYAKRVNNFIVILDLSISMTESYNSRYKYKNAVDIVSRFNQTIPDLRLFSAIRTFGDYNCSFCKTTKLIYGPESYSKARFDKALRRIQGANGESPLELALVAARQDIKTFEGKVAVIIVSDFKEMQKNSIDAVSRIQEEFGSRISLFNIIVGNDLEGKNLMSNISSKVENSFSVTADSIYSRENMANFVKMIFLEKILDSDKDGVFDKLDQCPNTDIGLEVDQLGCPIDSDNDGVYNTIDKCSNTPEGVSVDKNGCPFDTDKDGVYDYIDLCPNTPPDAVVNSKGCWQLQKHYLGELCPNTYAYLDDIVEIMNRNQKKCFNIIVKSSRLKSVEGNNELAKIWGNDLKSYLISKGISSERLSVYAGAMKLKADSDSSSMTDYNKTSVIIKPTLCLVDSDKDGVFDKNDKCPNTPSGVEVDISGCPYVEKKSIDLKIEFDPNKYNIKENDWINLKKVADYLNDHPNTEATIEAHTDSQGGELFNLKLSQQRANSVVKYLIDYFGIPASRLRAVGYGEKIPVASNSTIEGRKKNRRAIAVISTVH